MAQIYISYSKSDRHAAKAIVGAIRQAGLNAFDESDLQLDVDLEHHIARAVDTAQCVIILWSKAAAESEWLQFEIQRALQAWASGRLVLATLDETPLPVGLRDLSPIQITEGDDSGTQKLIGRVKLVLLTDKYRAAPLAVVGATAEVPVASKRWRPGWLIGALLSLILVVGVVPISFQRANVREPSIIVQKNSKTTILPEIVEPERAPDLLFLILGSGIGFLIGAAAVWIILSRRRRGVAAPAMQATHLMNVAEAPSRPPQVFVSYSHQDERAVDALVKQIEELGHAIWIDRQSTGSQRYAGKIVEAIKTSRFIALMCSSNAFASDHVIREVYIAGDLKKPFIVFLLEPGDLPNDILYFVTGFPRITVTKMDMQALRLEISRLVSTE
jgi:hypothetical protein